MQLLDAKDYIWQALHQSIAVSLAHAQDISKLWTTLATGQSFFTGKQSHANKYHFAENFPTDEQSWINKHHYPHLT